MNYLKIKSLFLMLVFCQIFASCAYFQENNEKGMGEVDIDGKIHLNVKKKVFENGATLLFVKNSDLPVFTYQTLVKVGSRDEKKHHTGLSHFLEHLLFKGSQKYPPRYFENFIEMNGGNNNAYTNSDITVYYEEIIKNAFEELVDIEFDRLKNMVVSPDEFEKERQVILEERKMRYENSPFGKLILEKEKEIYRGTPYENSTIGEIADIKRLKFDEVYAYYKNYYRPENFIFVVIGDLEYEKVVGAISKQLGNWPKDSWEREKIRPSSFYLKTKFQKSHMKLHGNSPTPMFQYVYKGEKIGTRDSYILDLLAEVMASGKSSYLNNKLVHGKKSYLTGISANHSTGQYNGLLEVGGRLLRGVSFIDFQKEYERAMREFCEVGLTERTLQKAKNGYLIGSYHSLKTNHGLASILGLYELYFGNYNEFLKSFETYQGISLGEAKRVCRHYLKKDNYYLFSVWDKHPKKK